MLRAAGHAADGLRLFGVPDGDTAVRDPLAVAWRLSESGRSSRAGALVTADPLGEVSEVGDVGGDGVQVGPVGVPCGARIDYLGAVRLGVVIGYLSECSGLGGGGRADGGLSVLT